ncbi:MAG TPA: NADH-quinone oxidoreductase subunit H [Alphaproteobacteria bacterium]|nr:NADH-quinone oxidoreductase subunit H [Alphaproteobacteria bacterium]
MSTAAAIIVLFAVLAGGAWLAATLDRAALALAAERPVAVAVMAGPWRRGALHLMRQRIRTERPDATNWRLAPAAYLLLAAVGISVVPFAPGFVVADLNAGIVLWGACEALTVVVVFLHGWSPNAPLPLIGAYRYVAIGLPVILLSMFVLIAAALPAGSLSVSAIVDSQASLWNVVRQPPGLLLFLMLGLSLTLRGPFDYADAADLAGGTSAEDSGPAQAAWQAARLAMLVSVSAMASAVFLGGYHGPWLPGPVWMLLKMAVVLAALVAATHMVARLPPARMLTFLWTILLPASFLVLVLVGAEVLLWK